MARPFVGQGGGRNGGALSLTQIREGCTRAEKAYAMMRKMRATVRVMCGYGDDKLRRMSWKELAEAYNDCIYVRENTR